MIRIGETLEGKYKVLRKIGQGGMSSVYLVMDNRLNKTWALKSIQKCKIDVRDILHNSLLSEIEILKKIDHLSFPRIVDVIEDFNHISIVMDFVDGTPLDKLLEEGKTLPESEVIQIGLQLCDALSYLHELPNPIIYRDLKPSNMVLDSSGKIKLIDFGIAREFKNQNNSDTLCLGTKGYAAPEQYGGKGQTDQRTDIFCLGVTLYHLLTGKNLSTPPYEITFKQLTSLKISHNFQKVILRATRINPTNRYLSCREFKYALEQLIIKDNGKILFIKKEQNKALLYFLILVISFLALYINKLPIINTLKQDFILTMDQFDKKNLIKAIEKIVSEIEGFMQKWDNNIYGS